MVNVAETLLAGVEIIVWFFYHLKELCKNIQPSRSSKLSVQTINIHECRQKEGRTDTHFNVIVTIPEME